MSEINNETHSLNQLNNGEVQETSLAVLHFDQPALISSSDLGIQRRAPTITTNCTSNQRFEAFAALSFPWIWGVWENLTVSLRLRFGLGENMGFDGVLTPAGSQWQLKILRPLPYIYLGYKNKSSMKWLLKTQSQQLAILALPHFSSPFPLKWTSLTQTIQGGMMWWNKLPAGVFCWRTNTLLWTILTWFVRIKRKVVSRFL